MRDTNEQKKAREEHREYDRGWLDAATILKTLSVTFARAVALRLDFTRKNDAWGKSYPDRYWYAEGYNDRIDHEEET